MHQMISPIQIQSNQLLIKFLFQQQQQLQPQAPYDEQNRILTKPPCQNKQNNQQQFEQINQDTVPPYSKISEKNKKYNKRNLKFFKSSFSIISQYDIFQKKSQLIILFQNAVFTRQKSNIQYTGSLKLASENFGFVNQFQKNKLSNDQEKQNKQPLLKQYGLTSQDKQHQKIILEKKIDQQSKQLLNIDQHKQQNLHYNDEQNIDIFQIQRLQRFVSSPLKPNPKIYYRSYKIKLIL